jgi:hypothetical protein
MSENITEEMSREQRILRMMKHVLTDVARDTHVKPGFKHPLSDQTIMGIRDCLALITARETELAEEAGVTELARPRFVDEPKTSFVVNIDEFTKKDK